MKMPFALLAAVAAVPVFAQDFEDRPTPLDPLVVTATRSEQSLSDIVASVDVISREAIERAQASDIAGLLRTVAGIDVTRNGGPGASVSVFIRGLESNHTLFLVDGVRYTSESFLNAQVQNLAPEMIERIEIVKGPHSGLWGSDAMGGVVNIITRRPQEAFGGNAMLRIGSQGAREASGFIGYRADRGELGLSLQAQQFDGFPPLRSGTEDRGHENLNANLRGAVDIGGARLGLRHMEATGINDYDFGAPRSQDFTNRISAADLSGSLGSWNTRGTLSLARDLLQQREPSDASRPQQFDYTEVRRRAVEWDNQFEVQGMAFAAGAAASQSDISSGFYSEFGDSFIEGRSAQHAVFGRAQLALGPVDSSFAARYSNHNRFGSFTTGDFALGYRWNATRLGVASGTGYKEPELTDLYGDFGNPDLEPERSASIEINIRQDLGANQVLTVAGFQTIVSNLIAYTCTANCGGPDFFDDVYELQNVERTRIRGLEARWQWVEGPWQSSLSGSMQNPINETTGQVLLRRSRRSVQAQLGRRFGDWSSHVEVLAHGERRDSGDVRLGGYALLGAALEYAIAPGWSIAARGDNLLDKDYELIEGFRTPPRIGSLALRATF